ncbi:hypothetical protein [Clostridium massiliamazoniense]|uniref:hypothetical protein n=1 Tax=Clostridium massiliamazoniense TaxID=1347366 RepID=UPI0006D7AD09|nr:hypothetical protein [Clostridium massiliamazoniense]
MMKIELKVELNDGQEELIKKVEKQIEIIYEVISENDGKVIKIITEKELNEMIDEKLKKEFGSKFKNELSNEILKKSIKKLIFENN